MKYITGNVIAAGFPAVGLATMWRNDRTVLINRLNDDHKGMVKIYNLCAEADMQYNSEDM
jgi:hypothetical protein